MISIERRIRTGLVLSLLLIFTLLAVLADYGVKQLSQGFIVTRLQHDSDSLIKALTFSSNDSWELNQQHIPTIYQRVKSGHYFQIRAGQQLIRSRSLWDQTPKITDNPTANGLTTTETYGDESRLIWQQEIEYQGHSVTLWIAEDIAPFEQQWRQFSFVLYASMITALGLLVLLQRYLLRKSFRQVHSLKQAIQRLQQGEIEALADDVPSEIQPLTEEINHLLQRLEQRISRSRTAMGNLAHELKRVLQQLHLLQSSLPESIQPEFAEALEQIRRLTERELKRARIAGTPHPGRRFIPNQDIPHLSELFKRIYPHIELAAQAVESSELPFDRDDMLELIGNLVDNGCKFGVSRVSLDLTLDNEALVIKVSDDGAGIPQSMRTDLLERGARIDESISGHGLGLSICKMIIDSYAGQLQISSDQSENSYCEVTVRLPLS